MLSLRAPRPALAGAPLALIALLLVLSLAFVQQVAAQQNNNNNANTQQQQRTSATAAASSGTARPVSGSANATSAPASSAANAPAGSTYVVLTTSVNGTRTSIFNVTMVSTPTYTPTTFPTAPIISTGALAGTAVAPAPEGGSAVGPNDSYVVSAARALSSPVALAASASLLAVLCGSLLLL